MRRFATRNVGANGGGSHLDADELNAFAEGVLPAAARARYISHLAECDHCRRQVADLSIASGAVARAEQKVVEPDRVGLWGRLFALPMLRYAAIAAALVVVAGVTFVALRQRSQSTESLMVKNEGDQSATYATTPLADSNNSVAQPSISPSTAPAANDYLEPGKVPAPAVAQPTASQSSAGVLDRQETLRSADNTTAPAGPMKEAAKLPEVATKAGEESRVAKAMPYSPPPPGEKQALSQVQTQSSGGYAASPGGPRQQQNQNQNQNFVLQPENKPVVRSDRERDAVKDARLDDRDRKSEQAILAGRASDEKSKGGPSRNMDNVANNRASNEARRNEPAKTDGADSEDKSETRSAGGHKFKRQGNAWVDQKFKSSMSLKTVARGSDEFSSLDSGLRSIAQQIGGEVIVVWKGKAYVFK